MSLNALRTLVRTLARPLGIAVGLSVGLESVAPQSVAASFDCAKAGNWIEKTICAKAALSKLDDQLEQNYRAALRKTNDAAALRESQRSWLTNNRNTCTTPQCLTQTYQTRLGRLAQITQGGAQKTQIAGRYRRWFESKPDGNSAQIQIRPLGGGVLFVTGDATWTDQTRPGFARTGSFQGTVVSAGNRIAFAEDQAAASDADSAGCAMVIRVSKDALDVSDDNGRCGGLNVTFDGHYRKMPR